MVLVNLDVISDPHQKLNIWNICYRASNYALRFKIWVDSGFELGSV